MLLAIKGALVSIGKFIKRNQDEIRESLGFIAAGIAIWYFCRGASRTLIEMSSIIGREMRIGVADVVPLVETLLIEFDARFHDVIVDTVKTSLNETEKICYLGATI